MEKKKKNIWNRPMSGMAMTIIGLIMLLLSKIVGIVEGSGVGDAIITGFNFFGIIGIIFFVIGLMRWNKEIKDKKKNKEIKKGVL